MPMYDGVVNLAEDDIPVIVELDDGVVRLSASGKEVAQWKEGEYEIRHLGDSTFAIRAENETLEFVPSQPSRFAAAVNGGLSTDTPDVSTEPPTSPIPEPETQKPTSAIQPKEAPPPKPLTMGLFYALCLVTTGLAIWSIISLIM